MNIILKIARHGLLTLLCLAGFSASADTQADQDSLMAANTSFAFDLFKQLAGKQPDGNVFISPYSVSTVLQMVLDGATGSTKQEMESVLYLNEMVGDTAAGGPKQEIESVRYLNGMAARDEACKSLVQSITSGQSNVTLTLANSIWFKQGVELRPEFLAGCSNYFKAETGALDFTSPQSAKGINE